MADLTKMKAFGGGGGGGKKGGGGGGEAEPEHAEGAEGEGGEDMQEQGEGKYSDLIPLLEQYAGEIEDAATMMAEDPRNVIGLADPNEIKDETLSEAMEGFEGLDGEIKDAIDEFCTGVPVEDCEELAKHLGDEGIAEDPDSIAAFLYAVGHALKVKGDADGDGEGAETDDEGDVDADGGGEDGDGD